MRFVPFERETIVLPVAGHFVADLIREKTQTRPEETQGRVFKGLVKKHSFTVTLRASRAQLLLPQVHGDIEDTSSGCIVFLKYRFFPNTYFFLIFWTILSFALALLFLGPANNYLYGCLSLAFCVLNYLIALANFDIHLKHIKKALENVLQQLKR